MVLAGIFKYWNNVEEMVSKLKGMGYVNVFVEFFDWGCYVVVLVDCFDGFVSVQVLKLEFFGKGVEVYVKQKQEKNSCIEKFDSVVVQLVDCFVLKNLCYFGKND